MLLIINKFRLKNYNLIKFIGFLTCVFVLLYYLIFSKSRKYQAINDLEFNRLSIANECIAIYKTLRYSNNTFRPPLQNLPETILKHQKEIVVKTNLYIPILKYEYFDDSSVDSHLASSDPNFKALNYEIPTINQSLVEEWFGYIKNGSKLMYDDLSLLKAMRKYSSFVVNKDVVIFGSWKTYWIEALSLMMNATSITGLNYSRRKYTNKRLKWSHTLDYFENALRSNRFEEFDVAVSFSSVDKFGLGRFGEPLFLFNGDHLAMQQIRCMIKPYGVLFLGIETAEQSSIVFNSNRVIGKKRLETLFIGWEVLEEWTSKTFFKHQLFLLQKVPV